MEYMRHGSLYDVLHNESAVLEGEMLLPIMRDIAQGVRFLHSADPEIIHGDLKAHNILVDSSFRAKVSDFGLTQKRQLGATGSPYWMAPELLRGEASNSAETDVYSFGVIVYEIYSRKDPYDGEDADEVLRQVADPKINKRPLIPVGCPPVAKAIMVECLSSDPDMRPTFSDVDSQLKSAKSADLQPIASSDSMYVTRSSQTNGMINELAKGNRSSELLAQMFPAHVSKALQESRAVEAQHCDCATVICADIANMNELTEMLSREELVGLLDNLHLQLKQLCKKHQVFKIETNGHSFLGVTNVVKEQANHAKIAAEFCVDALRTVTAEDGVVQEQAPASPPSLSLRMGFHSGPVTADVVGSRCPRYCLFGDTVTIAKRLTETCYTSNSIQCSDLSSELVQSQGCFTISFKQRRPISLKGQGSVIGHSVVPASSS